MIGWDSVIIQRAAARRALIFHEGMKFRRLEENEMNAEISILPDRIDIDPDEPGKL